MDRIGSWLRAELGSTLASTYKGLHFLGNGNFSSIHPLKETNMFRMANKALVAAVASLSLCPALARTVSDNGKSPSPFYDDC